MEMKIEGIRKAIKVDDTVGKNEDFTFQIDEAENSMTINDEKFIFPNGYTSDNRYNILNTYNTVSESYMSLKSKRFETDEENMSITIKYLSESSLEVLINFAYRKQQKRYYMSIENDKSVKSYYTIPYYSSIFGKVYTSFEDAFKSLMNLLMISVDMDKVNAFLLLKNIKGED